jgi:hypothetical protein
MYLYAGEKIIEKDAVNTTPSTRIILNTNIQCSQRGTCEGRGRVVHKSRASESSDGYISAVHNEKKKVCAQQILYYRTKQKEI